VLMCALVACKGTHDESSAPIPPKRDAGVVAVDWAACEKTLRALPAHLDHGDVVRLIDGCRVCGDWTPILDWNRPHKDGGPTRLAIEEAMARCNGYCDATAKQYFLGTLDDARGTDSRKPWRVLGEQCKDKVSAVPDARFVSAPYFALDRIARAIGAHGGELAALAAKLEMPLPALSVTGVGVELAVVDASTARPPRVGARSVTIAGDQTLLGELPVAHLGAGGVVVGPVTPRHAGYPGRHVPVADFALTIDDREALDGIVLLAPKGMQAHRLVPIVAAIEPRPVALAVDAGAVMWRVPAVLAGSLAAREPPADTALAKASVSLDVTDAMTVQELATAIAKLGDKHVVLRRPQAKR
jgi:hypothetical protein